MEYFSHYHFKEIQDKEKIISVIHRHWFNILQHFFSMILLSIVLFAGFFISPTMVPVLQDKDFYRLFLFVESTLAVFIFMYSFILWIDYYFDVWIITDIRIVNIEQKGVFVRQVSEMKFERIQDVTTKVGGLIPTILNYGDVIIQTAGERERFHFRMVPDPYAIKDLIMNLQKTAEIEETNELGEVVSRKIHEDLF